MTGAASLAVRAVDLGKRYRLGSSLPELGLGLGSLGLRALRLGRREAGHAAGRAGQGARDELWALRDVCFEVAAGEAIGIVGRNGAGKSTLLKILSRITPPSRGYAEIRGRASSLLEVGTGFHPELSGRENVFLNGAILGMRRAEIRRRFDEIVAFSGVEEFLDTPVKRYSTGMRVRLAFAVAAHLESEVMIIDEVLAVGDHRFQQKCLGKMDDIAAGGRTVLFVSHNLPAVRALCSRALYLEAGRVRALGPCEEVLDRYLGDLQTRAEVPLAERADREGSGRVRFTRLRVVPGQGAAEQQPRTGGPLQIELAYEALPAAPVKDLRVAISCFDRYGNRLFAVDSGHVGQSFEAAPARGEVVCSLPRLPLAAGDYRLDVWATAGGDVADAVLHAARLQVATGDFYGTGRITLAHKHGPFLVEQGWSLARDEDAAPAAAAGDRG